MTKRELTVDSTATIRIKSAVFNFEAGVVRITGLLWPDIPIRLGEKGVFQTDFTFALPLRTLETEELLAAVYALIDPKVAKDAKDLKDSS